MSWTFNPFTGKFDFYESVTSSDPTIITKTAGENISALQFVYSTSPNDVLISTSVNGFSPIGIAISAALSGASITIKTFGQLSDASFSFGTNELFLSSTGFCTATPVSSGFHARVAKGMGTGSIFINIDDLIELI